MTESDVGMSVKELVLRLEGKIDAFIIAHETRHLVESDADYRARSDPSQSAAGSALDARISDLGKDVDSLASMGFVDCYKCCHKSDQCEVSV